MKLRVYSDLHLEFADFELPYTEDDKESILVLAGDIWTAGRAGARLLQWAPRFRSAMLVLGNHDFYGSSLDVVPDQICEQIESGRRGGIRNAHLLDNSSVIVRNQESGGEVAFIGATLWTRYQDGPDSPFGYDAIPWNARLAENHIADHRHIVIGPLYSEETAPLRATRLVEEYDRSLEYIEEEVRRQRQAGRKTVVITHHVPSYHLADAYYEGDMLGPAFCSHALDQLPEDALPDIWVFGHQHYSQSTTHRGVRCVSNCRGYPGEGVEFDDGGLGLEL